MIEAPSLELTPEDHITRARLDSKQDDLRSAVDMLVKGYETGLFVWGEGGSRKSFVVENTLKELHADFAKHNSRVSARGLFDSLRERPTAIHWIEDAEPLFTDKTALGILRSACWSQCDKRPPERPISWVTAGGDSFTFTGGILAISNANLVDSSPELRAVKSRVRVLEMGLSPNEMRVLMKTACQAGYTYGDESMSPGECWQVATFIQEKLSLLNRNMDLRLFKQCFRSFLYWRNQDSSKHWQELIESRMKEAPTDIPLSRAAKSIQESAFARELDAMNLPGEEKERRWMRQTGKSYKSYYRALRRPQ